MADARFCLMICLVIVNTGVSRGCSECHGGRLLSNNVTFPLQLWKSYGNMTATFVILFRSCDQLASCVTSTLLSVFLNNLHW